MEQAERIAGFYAPVHRALTEPILLGGAPRAVAIVNGTLAAAIGLGLRLWIVGAAIWLIGHLRSDDETYMASVSWVYSGDQLVALRRQNAFAEASTPVADGVDIDALNFRYRIEGDSPAWRPLRAFDDGRQVFIAFPAGIGQGEMPPLWVIGAEGGAELVNYRVRGNHMIVDRLFAAAELRLGGAHQQKVRIVRTDGRPRS